MGVLLERGTRNVIPNFRSFHDTVRLGELQSERVAKISALPSISLDTKIQDWKANPVMGVAADLLSAAIISDADRNPSLTEAANFVLSNQEGASSIMLDFARLVLGNTALISEESTQGLIIDQVGVRSKIHRCRIAIRQFPENPLPYVEVSRLYSILGQKDAAKKSMRIAATLAPGNRYVMRSMVRLYSHFGEHDLARHTLRKQANLSDPWILASEIALTTLLGQDTRNVKKGLGLVDSANFTPLSKSELASALATIELHAGSSGKSRKLFNRSLIQPTDNALAQAKWAADTTSIIEVQPSEFPLLRKFEADAWEAYRNEEWTESIQAAEAWFNDMPFIRSPIILGSHVAFYFLDKPSLAAKFIRAGLVSHPKDALLLNNLAYYLAETGEWQEAGFVLDSITPTHDMDESVRISILATKGLVAFKSGNVALGNRLYSEAIEASEKLKDKTVFLTAMLNFARQAFYYKDPNNLKLFNQLSQLETPDSQPALGVLRQRALNVFKEVNTVWVQAPGT